MTLRGPPDERSPAALLAFGLVNLDKPPGPSAHQVAGWVRDIAADAIAAGAPDTEATVERAAHAGTLDPKVTGCLPMLTGDAVRLAPVFADSPKEYVAELVLHGPAPADFESVVATFEAPLYQKPPRKSAVRRQLRVREIFDLDVLEREDRRALLRIRCEAGTYVRKLCHDLGLALGTGAHMGDLRRTATGPFDDTTLRSMHDYVDALSFWTEDGDVGPLREVVQPAEVALEGLPRLTIAPSAAREVAEGAPVYAPGILEVGPDARDLLRDGQPTDAAADTLVAAFTPDEAAVCLGHLVGDPDADRGEVLALERVLV